MAEGESKGDDIMRLEKYEIAPGQSGVVGLNVGALPSDTNIYINVYVYRSDRPGPTLLIVGGLHGDEINGIEIVRRAIAEESFSQLDAGSVIAIPLLNVYGFINFSRNVSIGRDVNRSFPGSSRGSLASRVANVMTREVLPNADLILDLHTGGAGRYNYPQTRFTKGDSESQQLAAAFGAPFLIDKPVIGKSLRKTANKMLTPIVVYESGEALRIDEISIETGLQGIRNVMNSAGIKSFPEQESPHALQIHITRSGWTRASAAGIFQMYRSSGDYIEHGELLGTISDPYGSRSVPVVAKRTGFIVGHTNTPVVAHGDPLFHVGYEYEELRP